MRLTAHRNSFSILINYVEEKSENLFVIMSFKLETNM